MKQTRRPIDEQVSTWFHQHYAWLTSHIARQTRCHFCAEDIASEAFARLLQKSAGEDIREPRALLARIAQRLLYEMWRRRDLGQAYINWAVTQPQATSQSPEERVLIFESLATIDHALDGLSAKARSAFFHSRLDGLTYLETATRLGVSTRMVQKYMTAAIRLCHLTDRS